MSGESNPVDEFIPLPDLPASLIPPTHTPVPLIVSGYEHGVGDGRTGGDLYFAGTREGSSGIDDGAAQGRGIYDDAVGSQGFRSAGEDDGAEEGDCGVGGCGDGDLESGIGIGFNQGGDLESGSGIGSGVDHAGVSKPAGLKKRFRGREGSDVRVGPPRELGAVELALRNASTRTTKYILEPVLGTSFDSLAEAYEFYNLYSWEAGFGIRYGNNYTNGKGYRSSQDLVCQMEGYDKREQNDSARCGCKALIRLHRSKDHGWFVESNRPDHNHPLSDSCGEKMQWNSHKKIVQATKDTVSYLRENNVSLSRVHQILGSMHRSGGRLPFPRKSLRTVCQLVDQMVDQASSRVWLTVGQ